MTTSLIDQVKRDLRIDEGIRSKPYRDTVGKLTIGVGRNLDDVGLSADEIEFLLDNDLKRVCLDLDHLIPQWRGYAEPVQRVLINLAFNLGVRKLATFKKTLKFIDLRLYKSAADELLRSTYAAQVGARAQRLAEILRSVV